MEPILTLDIADSPAKLRVISFEADKLKVWSEVSVELLQKPEVVELSPEKASQSGLEQNQSLEEAPMETVFPTPSEYFVSQLSSAIEKLEPVWSSSAILISPKSYHSLNLELPFKDDKNVVKVLSLETQDRLPFDVDEFFLEHKVLGTMPDNQYDVHVALSSKQEIGTLISNCREAGLDPIAISTVASLLEGKVSSNPEIFSRNAVFLSLHGNNAHLAFRVDGEFKSDRTFALKDKTLANIISEVQRSIGAVESRYLKPFEEIWLDVANFSNAPDETDSSYARQEDTAAISVALTIERVKAALESAVNIPLKLLKQDDGDSYRQLTDFFAPLCNEGKTSKLFINFRTGQFSQTLRWAELWRITSSALPYLFMVCLFGAGILIATYLSREQEINKLQQAVIEKVQPLLGDNKLISGQVVKSIQTANDTIEKQLKDLGSPSKYSPLDVLSEVTRDFSSIKDVTITSVSIRGTQLTVVGSSKNYENVDAIEKVLQAKRTLYCRPSNNVSGTTTRQFTFTVTLCD